MANYTNHPPRSNIVLKPSKGGRKVMVGGQYTPAEADEIRGHAQRAGMSIVEWILYCSRTMSGNTPPAPIQRAARPEPEPPALDLPDGAFPLFGYRDDAGRLHLVDKDGQVLGQVR